MSKPSLLLGALLMLAPIASAAAAQTPPKPALSIKDVEKVRDLNSKINELTKVLADVNTLQDLLKAVTEEKKIECIGAFGHLAFCSCIAENVPATMSFQLYSVLLSKGRESFGYPSGVSTDDKALMDGAYEAREKCVAETFGPK